MSDLRRPRHMAGLEALSGASPKAPPNRELRATDEFFGNLHVLDRYRRLTEDEVSGTGAFQQVIEDLERQREWLRAVGEPYRYQSFAFDFGSRPEPVQIARGERAADRPLPAPKKSLPVGLKQRLAY